MSDTVKAGAKAPAKRKSPTNWPIIICSGLCLAFIVGVWANNYRVTQAAAAEAKAAASLAAKK